MNAKIAQRWLAVGLLLAVGSVLTSVERARASDVEGTWIIKDLVLQIFDCRQLVCGRIVGIRDAARRPAQCGKTIVWGLVSKGPNEWGEGSILDPDNGNVYRLSATFELDGTLHARIFKGIPMLGKTEVLRQIDLRSFSGQC